MPINNDEQSKPDIIDEDLYEEFDDEELYELVQEARKEALRKSAERNKKKPKRPFPKWMFWMIALAMVFHIVALIPQTFSIPAIDFLVTSAKLSTDDAIKEYKQAVVVIEAGDSRGTGFSISSDGTIITNYHVVESEDKVTVAFPEHGLFVAMVEEVYPEVDLAILQVENDVNLPSLDVASKTTFTEDEEIYFIGNPLRFQGIANEGTVIGYTELNNWEEKVLMIDAPVYRGNSGSPIINKEGLVIGVVFATMKHEDHGKVGLFVPIDYYYQYRGLAN